MKITTNMSEGQFTLIQLAVTTAEEERNYFNGLTVHPPQPNMAALLPTGIYRVIEGELCRVVNGVPLSLR